MTPALVMLGYAAALAWFGPAPLARLTRAGVSARLGLAVWLAAMASALGSAVVAVYFLVRTTIDGWPGFAGTICQSVTGGPCPPQLYRSAIFEASVAAASAIAVLTVITLTWRYGRSVHGARRRASEHAQAARITGRRFPGAGIPALSAAVVLDTPQPAVYCVPGRPATIVLTTGALAVLDQPQLLAVLAHERAHLAGRHHLLVTLSKAARAGFPGVPLFTRAAEEVARLAEMRADDAAARRSGRETLLQALVAMGTGRPLPPPSTALAATGGAVTARVRRLLDPPSRASRAGYGLALTGALVALGAVSILLPVFS
ncbi:MAG TPA: M56 family metallopeptidase [Trebonia sp.]|jgi:Zn-dependent protease with chaperone function|nr:M56 family metallopeptidase [Trebonia sp.]